MTLFDERPGLHEYLRAALETETDEDGKPLDGLYPVERFAPVAVLQAYHDLVQAFALADRFVPDWPRYWSVDQFAGDFLLTRNRHGLGFWARAPEEDLDFVETGERLTAIAESFRPAETYVGDDGLLYFG